MQSRRRFLSSIAALSIASATSGCARYVRDSSILDAIDALMRRFMHDMSVPAGQLAILRNGSTIFSKVYAGPPPAGYAAVTPQTLFRLASCSKIFTRAAISALVARGRLDLNQRVFALLGIDKPALAGDHPDPHINNITVQHLVDHAGGWNVHQPFHGIGGVYVEAYHWDPMFRLRKVALDLGLPVPPTKLDVARYMYGKPLQFVPGTQNYLTSHGNSYSNFGYVLLGLVVEAVTRGRYIDFVRDGIDGAGAWPNVLVSPMLSRQKNPLEVWYVEPEVGLSALEPQSDAMLPFADGGGGFITEVMDSAAGLMTNAETLARFVSRHAVRGLGGREAGQQFDGSMAGTYSTAYSRPNGIDCAYLLNTVEFPDGFAPVDTFTSLLREQLDAF